MKYLILILMLSSLGKNGSSQTTLFSWDVDSVHYIQPIDASNFQISYFDEDGLTPAGATGFPVSSYIIGNVFGTDVLAAASWFDPNPNNDPADNWVVFGPITLPSSGIQELSWESNVSHASFRDGYRVMVGDVGPNPIDFSSGTTIFSKTDNDPSTIGGDTLTPYSALLPASFQGNQIYVAFHHNATDMWAIAFDKFKLVSISNSSSSSFSITECVSYTVPSGDETYTNSGTYMDTIPNTVGGDSIMTINLTINTVNTGLTSTDPTLTADATGASYQWLECPSYALISGETSQSFTATQNGDYAVEITENGCVDTSDCILIQSVGINELETNLDFKVYPNPSNGEFIIEFSKNINEQKLNIRLYNIEGKEIPIELKSLMGEISFESESNPGVYILKVELGDQLFVRKINKL